MIRTTFIAAALAATTLATVAALAIGAGEARAAAHGVPARGAVADTPVRVTPDSPARRTTEVAPGDAQQMVSIVEPRDGATVTSPFKIRFAIEGMKLMPAGNVVAGSGHHHVIVDGKPVPFGERMPNDPQHIHYDVAQTEATLTLPPGRHTLTAQFANGEEISYGPQMSRTITITVR